MIDLVLRTGGSSLIPAVKDILENQFAGKVVEHDPFTSVAAGLPLLIILVTAQIFLNRASLQELP